MRHLFFWVCIVGVARADVYQPGTLPRSYPTDAGVGDNLLPVTLQLERARYCLDCHDDSVYDSTRPGATWKGTMMANAARDPLMYAALAVANQDVPNVGGDFCLRCHSPAGYLAGHTLPNPPYAGQPAQAENPSRFPCNSYEVGSLTQCRLLPDGTRDFCREPAANVHNGYCILDFEDATQQDPNFRTHPFTLDEHHPEPNEQRIAITDGGTPKDVYDDTEGLACPFCHRVDPNVTPVNRFGGNYHINDESELRMYWETPRSRRFGPYDGGITNCTNPDDATTCEGDTAHPHPTGQSALHTESEFCGQCHDVTNPLLDRLSPSGVDQGYRMPIERTFSEWKASAFAQPGTDFKTCQGCHMAAGSDGALCLSANRSPLTRKAPPRHVFAGGSAWLPSVFAAPMPPMPDGSGDPRWFYDLFQQVARTQAYLAVSQAAAATLQASATLGVVQSPASTTSGGSVAFRVRVTNLTGHKLPTGYPEGRRMWLQVVAGVAGKAQPFFQSGAWDSATGLLTRDAQLKIYEAELAVAGAPRDDYPKSFHFVKNQIVYKDNRIPPKGFDPNASSYAEMAPVMDPGVATYPTGNDGKIVNWDETGYTVPVPAFATGDVAVTVRLVYQSTSKEYVEFLDSENRTNPRGSDVLRIWKNHGRAPFNVMAEQTFLVRNTNPCVPQAEVCNGLDDDCSGVADDDNACADMAAGPDDMGATAPPPDAGLSPDLGMKKKGHGCYVSIAGGDWSDLTPLALLGVLGVLYRRRHRAWHP